MFSSYRRLSSGSLVTRVQMKKTAVRKETRPPLQAGGGGGRRGEEDTRAPLWGAGSGCGSGGGWVGGEEGDEAPLAGRWGVR